ncbi:IS630 transposase-related protein [Candidatus Fukatsuia endosymbiont of Tuberolachnus salignus]
MRWAKRIDPCLTRNKPATKINRAALLLDVETYPDVSQYERAQRMGGSARGICDALKRAGFSYKKTLDLFGNSHLSNFHVINCCNQIKS